MTHDPLCPAPLCDYTGKPGAECMGYEDCWHDCRCDLIARVRDDERGYAKQTSTAIMAYDEGKRDGYTAALRDAVEAVKALDDDETAQRASRKREPDGDYYWALSDAVAAIEALGGERDSELETK